MKKNKMMRVASALLVAVLMTTSVISGTFAKYITTDSARDEARVAKWGVTVVVNGSLYGDAYADTANIISAEKTENAVSVYGKQSTAPKKVVAPGTKSDKGFHFAINGNPEVDSLITMEIKRRNVFLAKGNYGVMVEVEGVTKDNFPAAGLYQKAGDEYTLVTTWDEDVTNWYALHDAVEVENENGYWPVVYKMEGDTPYTSGATTSDSLEEIANEILGNISTTVSWTADSTNKSQYSATATKEMEQNVELSTLKMGDIKLTWEWKFDGVNDGADTILGNLMAKRVDVANAKGDVVKLDTSTGTYGQLEEGTDYCLDTMFSIDIRVEQLD